MLTARMVIEHLTRLTKITKYRFGIKLAHSQISQPTSTLKIKRLETLVANRARNDTRELFQKDISKLFRFGMDSTHFKFQYFTGFKQAYWQTNPLVRERLSKFIKICDEQDSALSEKKELSMEEQKKVKLIRQYRKHISLQVLPKLVSESSLSEMYLQQLGYYLQSCQSLNQRQITLITNNLFTIIYGPDRRYFTNNRDNAWVIIHSFGIFLDKINPNYSRLSSTIKGYIVSIARTLKIKNLSFLEYLKRDVQKIRKDLGLQTFLYALLYLGYNRSFPYEYFYANKQSLIEFIEAADSLSDKKVSISILMLEIFARNKLVYCEKIIQRLLKCIQENLNAADQTQITRIFYYYSRLKCGVESRFIAKLIERVYLFMDLMNETHYLLIVKSVANLNYSDDVFTQKLKEHNYELFLTSLKYGCQKLGSYYQAILNEVQSSYASNNQQALTGNTGDESNP